jgi:hypothetical protein
VIDMSIRATIMTLACAAAVASVLTPATSACANLNEWRFVSVHRSLTVCKNAGQALVTRHRAREYKCDNNYTEAGAPVLELYVR